MDFKTVGSFVERSLITLFYSSSDLRSNLGLEVFYCVGAQLCVMDFKREGSFDEREFNLTLLHFPSDILLRSNLALEVFYSVRTQMLASAQNLTKPSLMPT